MANVLIPNPVVPLTGSFAVIYTIGNNYVNAVVHIVNTTAVNHNVWLCLVPPAGVAGQDNALLWEFTITGFDVLEIARGAIFPAGYTIQAKSDGATLLNIHVSGVEAS